MKLRQWMIYVHFFGTLAAGLPVILISLTGGLLVYKDRLPDTAWLRIVERLHESLLLPPPYGGWIVALFGVALLALVGSGLYLWWPNVRRLRAALRLERGRGPIVRYYTLHNVIALYSLPLLLLTTFTGLFYVLGSWSGEAALSWNDRLHVGRWGGPAVRLVYATSGLVPLYLAWSGITLLVVKRRHRRR